VAQDIDDVKELYESELQQQNEDYLKLGDELKATRATLHSTQQSLSTAEANINSLEDELSQLQSSH
jgi:septal ring factor EnvC (AmiA/AmiB activator)